jgi:hypothetical protein
MRPGDLARADTRGQAVIGEVEVGDVRRRPSLVQELVRGLPEQDRLADLARTQDDHSAPVIQPEETLRHLLLKVASDPPGAGTARRRPAPPGIAVVEDAVQVHVYGTCCIEST